MAMKMADVGLLDEVFTHVDDVTGLQTGYAVGPLYKRCEQGGDGIVRSRIPVEEHHANYCVEHRGVERERLEELAQHPEWVAKPIVFIHMPDDTHLLVDGTHRYVLAFGIGAPELMAYIVEWNVAKDFVIEDLPQTDEKTLMAHSHLTALRKLFGA